MIGDTKKYIVSGKKVRGKKTSKFKKRGGVQV